MKYLNPMMNRLKQFLQENRKDGILYLCSQHFAEAKDSAGKQEAFNKVVELLRLINGEVMREDYIKELSRVTKISTKVYKDSLKRSFDKEVEKSTDDDAYMRISKEQREEFFKY
jgi:hypothetical protein